MEKELNYSELSKNFTELTNDELSQVSGGQTGGLKCQSCGSTQIVRVAGGYKCLDCGKIF